MSAEVEVLDPHPYSCIRCRRGRRLRRQPRAHPPRAPPHYLTDQPTSKHHLVILNESGDKKVIIHPVLVSEKVVGNDY